MRERRVAVEVEKKKENAETTGTMTIFRGILSVLIQLLACL